MQKRFFKSVNTPFISIESPIATVLLPVYNGDRYLRQAIESVLRQTFRDFELLLLNDGSIDNSLRIMESFAAMDERCRIHSWPNRGLVATLNSGIELANAEFIIRMDADDICRPTRFEKQISYLQRHPNCVAVGARVLFVDPDGMPIFEAVDRYTHEEIDNSLRTLGRAIAHPSATIRTSAIKAIGGYRSVYRHAEDLDLFLRLAEMGRLANLPEVLLDYRQHIESVSFKNVIEQATAARCAIREAYNRRGISWNDAVGLSAVPPTKGRSLSDVHRVWGWSALGAGNLATARKHAICALKLRPISFQNLLLAACALRGY